MLAGFPALSKAHQKVVGRLYDLDPLVIVRAAGVIDQTGHSHYQQYISSVGRAFPSHVPVSLPVSACVRVLLVG